MPFTDDINAEETPSFKEALSSEKIKAIYNVNYISMAGNLSSGVLIAVVLFINFGAFISISWYSLISSLSFLRLFFYKKFQKESMYRPNKFWARITFIWLILTSAAWSIIPAFLFKDAAVEYKIIMIFVITVIAAGGLSTLAVKKSYYMIYISFLILPLSYHFFMERTFTGYSIAFACIFYLFLLYFSGRRQCSVLEEGFKTKIKFETARNELRISETRFSAIFNEAPIGIFYYNSDFVIIECNEYFSKILRAPKPALIGLNMKKLNDLRIFPAISAIFEGKIGKYEGEYSTKISGTTLWVGLQTAPIYDKIGNISGGVGIVEDFTEKRKVEEKIEYQAYHDSLTLLPNRDLLLDRLKMAVKQSRRHGYKGALLFLDLDRFKTINDSLGHQIGDILLKQVANRLFNLTREEDTVARLGGDEFVILLPELSDDLHHALSYTKMVADKVHEALSVAFDVEGHVIHTATSIGASIFPQPDESHIDILKHADMAMYKAKEESNSSTHFYDTEMDEYLKKNLMLENDLSEALFKRQFEIYFQPIVEIRTGRIKGAEVLLRWNHPELGLVFPGDFIEIAEDTGLIIPIGTQVLEMSLETISTWSEHPFDKINHISINVSVKQFRQAGFVDNFRQMLEKYPGVAEKIILEFTESILIEDFQNTLMKIDEFRKYGVRFAIDDFGTGYSSLSYLKKLPLDILKIDREFIKDVLIDEDDAAIARTMIDIAAHFNLKIIAEGVETIDQVHFLDNLKCEFYQGYYCSKPVKLEVFKKLVTDNYSPEIR
ncbi:MAG: GGDEF domain-containing protein [Spirochaetes bacterium]|nr:GGDEF domain-containing protein [Spirochaetota bacterium]